MGTLRGEDCVKVETEMGVMQLQAKECLESPETERSKTGLFPIASVGTGLCQHLDFRPPASRTVTE